MMKHCAVQGCRSNSIKNPNLRFFFIPSDKYIRQEWMEVLCVEHANEVSVCELHFREKDFTSSGRLKCHAIPTVKVGKFDSRNSDDEFMQCDSGSDLEIIEVKNISKKTVKIKQEPADDSKPEKKAGVASPPPFLHKIMALTPAEKQKRYRERRRMNAEKEEENKRKDRERGRKRIPIKEKSARAQRAQRESWRSAQRKHHQNKAKKVISPVTSGTSDKNLQISAKKRGIKHVLLKKLKTVRENTQLRKEEIETGRRPSRRAAQLAAQKIQNTVRQYGLATEALISESRSSPQIKMDYKPRRAVTPQKTPRKMREQKVWHQIRAPIPDIDLTMECHEELLSPIQAEAILKAQTEYNAVMKRLRNLKASNARIICINGDESEMPTSPSSAIPSTALPTLQKASHIVPLSSTVVSNSPNVITVVPVHLVTVQTSSLTQVLKPPSSPAVYANITAD